MTPFPWNELGIARTGDVGAIRKAYAERLKAMDVDADPAGFARLRDARDTALRRARAAAASNEGRAIDDVPLDAPSPDTPAPDVLPPDALSPDAMPAVPRPGTAPGALAAPLLTAPGPDATVRASPQAPAHRFAGPADGFVPASEAAPPWGGGPVFFTPDLDVPVAPGQVRPPVPAPQRLYDLLLAGGDADDTPLDPDAEREARACLLVVLGEALVASLEQHDRIEQWLGEVLARSWPRCAPLLQEAAEALGWTREAGTLGETPARAFLSARLAGYRFQQDVQAPAHDFHRAWVELNRAGGAGLKPFLPGRAEGLKAQVAGLLGHVRRNFPEIESTFDPKRVASWDKSIAKAAKPGRSWTFRIRWWWVVTLLALRVLASLGDASHDSKSAPSPYLATNDVEVSGMAELAVADAFGPGRTLDSIRQVEPSLVDSAVTAVLDARDHKQPLDTAVPAFQATVRNRLYVALRKRGGGDFEALLAIRATLLAAAGRAGDKACDRFLKSGAMPEGYVRPDKLAQREQALAARMLDAGQLKRQSAGEPGMANVPGAIVARVIDDTGIGEKRVLSAMKGESRTADRCLVEAAMIRRALPWRGPERAALLRIL